MKPKLYLKIVVLILFIFCTGYIVSKTPTQKLKITAVTAAEKFDILGKTDIYYIKPLNAGESYNAVIKFMAVNNTSKNLFTYFGNGQYVYLGCSELKTEYEFISLGRFLNIKLTLNASQVDLKLENGEPFDITRYSLKPVLVIERKD